MSETAVVLPPPRKSKKEIREMIEQKLSVSLADYRSIVGEKKFDRQIRKAARRFGENVSKALPKKSKKIKKAKQENEA